MAKFKANWDTVEKTKIHADSMMSINSLSKKEEKYQREAVQLGTTNRTVTGGHKSAFDFYPWAYFQILSYFSA